MQTAPPPSSASCTSSRANRPSPHTLASSNSRASSSFHSLLGPTAPPCAACCGQCPISSIPSLSSRCLSSVDKASFSVITFSTHSLAARSIAHRPSGSGSRIPPSLSCTCAFTIPASTCSSPRHAPREPARRRAATPESLARLSNARAPRGWVARRLMANICSAAPAKFCSFARGFSTASSADVSSGGAPWPVFWRRATMLAS
mmetsp:Transcript_40625/g.96481  ORF Transcript_40625/g.96481 Transcript_40625/m.96481 type:complete len:203 (-) Transcript_40625:248-856(-)